MNTAEFFIISFDISFSEITPRIYFSLFSFPSVTLLSPLLFSIYFPSLSACLVLSWTSWNCRLLFILFTAASVSPLSITHSLLLTIDSTRTQCPPLRAVYELACVPRTSIALFHKCLSPSLPQLPWSRWRAPWPKWSCLIMCVTWSLLCLTATVSTHH